ncbi:MAG TPA: c-type cytochrome [Steroidobacteraceae bacterium]|nr:c-type cytochrome [Steroidobacteraceae bacterium]
MRQPVVCTLLLLGIHVGLAAAAPPEVTGCAKCHGDNGVSVKPEAPTIAGMSSPYLDAQMSAYQNGKRPCPKMSDPKLSDSDMCEAAKKLTATQVSETSAYYAGQKFVPASQSIDAALAAKGKALHDAHCATCHSGGGSEAADDAGILAGQWKPYLQATLQDYTAGKRAQPDSMKRQMSRLSSADVNALAEYYASGGH